MKTYLKMLDFPKKRDETSRLLRNTQRQVSFHIYRSFGIIHVKCRVRLYLVFVFPKWQYESKYGLKSDSMKVAEIQDIQVLMTFTETGTLTSTLHHNIFTYLDYVFSATFILSDFNPYLLSYIYINIYIYDKYNMDMNSIYMDIYIYIYIYIYISYHLQLIFWILSQSHIHWNIWNTLSRKPISCGFRVQWMFCYYKLLPE